MIVQAESLAAVVYGGPAQVGGKWWTYGRRLLGTLGDWAGDAESWLRALDKGGMESVVLYPTLGLFMSFVKDRQWAVALCRAWAANSSSVMNRRVPPIPWLAPRPVRPTWAAIA